MLSRRARENNAWFLEQFKRPLSRQKSKTPSSIDLATAENWLIRSEILSLFRRNGNAGLKLKHLSYSGGLGGTPELLGGLAKFFNHFFTPEIPVRPEHIVVGPGCSAVLDTLINDICDEGDGLLVTAPMWGTFEISAVLRNGVRILPVHVPPHESGSPQAVVEAYRTVANEATCNVRGILFCNPDNPHGHISTVQVIDALLQYCEQEDLHFVSDEIYALSTFGAIKEDYAGCGEVFESPASDFVSVLSRDLRKLGVNSSRVHLIYSISKDFGGSGMRLGCLVTQGNNELRLSQAILNNAKICNVASVMVEPVLRDIPKLSTLVALNTQRLCDAARIAIQFSETHGLSYYRPAAGLYIWVRLSEGCETWDEEEQIVRDCAQRGVLVGSGADYAELRAGWFRLTFAIPRHDFLKGLRRIEEVMGYKTRFGLGSATMSDSGLSSWLKFPSFGGLFLKPT
ncbi:PLP-dependent transferase [Rhizodiscina lignyota]|uniref:PLP-dependent transferase n=1 Tax=Rhizodiscina lignyota TaxID=1504668 RepID=A0A9P4I4J6_9PEZI|nr:PLP-dependent transferase [Rhizodiscina lignyota]